MLRTRICCLVVALTLLAMLSGPADAQVEPKYVIGFLDCGGSISFFGVNLANAIGWAEYHKVDPDHPGATVTVRVSISSDIDSASRTKSGSNYATATTSNINYLVQASVSGSVSASDSNGNTCYHTLY